MQVTDAVTCICFNSRDRSGKRSIMNFILKSVERKSIYTGLGDKGEPLNMPVSPPPYTIGVGLDVLFHSKSDRDAWCSNCRSNWFITKLNSRVEGYCGCEFATTPLSPEVAKDINTWRPLTGALRKARAFSFDTSISSLCVRVSRSIFGDDADALGRLAYLYYFVLSKTERSRYFQRMDGPDARDINRADAQKANAATVLRSSLQFKDIRTDVCRELAELASKRGDYNLNFNHEDIIEFRQGKGTLSPLRIASICEYVEGMCLYVKKNKDISKYNESDFMDSLSPESLISSIYNSSEY